MTPMIRRRERQASGGFCASCSGVSSSKVLRTPREKREQILDEYERGGIRGDGGAEVSDVGLVGAAAAQAWGWGERGRACRAALGGKAVAEPMGVAAALGRRMRVQIGTGGVGWKWPMGNRRHGLGRCCGRWGWCGAKFCRIGAGVRGAGALRYAARGSRDWRGWTLLASTIEGGLGGTPTLPWRAGQKNRKNLQSTGRFFTSSYFADCCGPRQWDDAPAAPCPLQSNSEPETGQRQANRVEQGTRAPRFRKLLIRAGSGSAQAGGGQSDSAASQSNPCEWRHLQPSNLAPAKRGPKKEILQCCWLLYKFNSSSLKSLP